MNTCAYHSEEIMVKNSKWLIITEKPTVAADIAKTLKGFEKKKEYYESDEYYLTWAVGHLVEFLEPQEIDAKYKRWLLKDLPILPEKFEYKVKKGQTERLNQIRALAKKANVAGYINACDAGREGELIFREIFDWCDQEKPFKRLWLQSLTAASIKQEFASLKDGHAFDNLADAARSRSESDWLIGINATRGLTKRLSTKKNIGVWSVGRVQTPTLALLVKREFSVLQHRPQPYFTFEGLFSTTNHNYIGLWFDPSRDEDSDRIASQAQLQEIIKVCEQKKQHAQATEIRKESREIAPGLFDLTLLQRESNRRFGMTATRTLQAAQRLYEKHKLLTYPRTDSRYLPEDYVDKVREVLRTYSDDKTDYTVISKKILKSGLLNQDRVFNNKLVSDHFAIIPTGENIHAKLDGDDARIYDLVVKRFLAAFMPHAVWDKIERITQIDIHHFRTRAQDLKVPGWREAYGLDTAEESRLPILNPDGSAASPVQVDKFESKSFLTKPPARYSEAKLLSLMEYCGKSVEDEEIADALLDKGLGTPATRADIIENLISKDYVVRSGKNLRPTFKGIRLVDILSRIPVEMLAKVELTGEMEFDLKQMEKGHKSRREFMKNMRVFATETTERIKTFQYDDLYKDGQSLGACPLCHKGKVYEEFWSYKCDLNTLFDKKSDPEHSAPSCSFILWKEKNARYVDQDLVRDLLAKKIIGPLEFPQMSGGASYEEYVMLLPERGIVFCTQDGVPKEEETKASDEVIHTEEIKETFLKMPGVLKVTNKFYLCEFETGKKKKVTSRMPRVLCTREMSLDEYKAFIILGETQPISDFKSKKGRAFSAFLKLKPNGNFEFKFIARKKEKNQSP